MGSLVAIVREPDHCWDDGPGYCLIVRSEKMAEWAEFMARAFGFGAWSHGDELNPEALYFRRFYPFYLAPTMAYNAERIARKHGVQIVERPKGARDDWWEELLKAHPHVRDWDTPDEEPSDEPDDRQQSLF